MIGIKTIKIKMANLYTSKKGLEFSIRQAVLNDIDNGLFDCLSELSQITWDKSKLHSAFLEREQTGCIFTYVAVIQVKEIVRRPLKSYIMPPPNRDYEEDDTMYDWERIREKTIGTASLILERKFLHDTQKVGHIEDVVVKKEYRGHGIGEQLVKFMTDFANAFGSYKVILACNEDNTKFYEKCGFHRHEVLMRLDT